jgi:hypothetical protein
MAKLLLLLAIICAGASFAFYSANGAVADVPNWANQVCSASRTLCQYPEGMAVAAAGLAGLWLMVAFVSAIRD